MNHSIRTKIEKAIKGTLAGALMLGLLCGCGKNEEVALVSEGSKSGVVFRVEYEEFLQEEFNMIFADSQDVSYMLSMEVLERPGDWDWKEVLVQCGNANIEDFVLAGISFYDWKTTDAGNCRVEYLSANEDDVLYSVGVVAMEGGNYGVMIYGNFGEDILLKTAREISAYENGFEVEMSGQFQNISLSNRGKSMESYKLQFFESEAQINAFLKNGEIPLKLKQIYDGKEISFAGNGGTAIGYGLDSNGKLFFAGQGLGTVGSYGLIELAGGKGFLLLEYSDRSREVRVESLPEHLEMLGKFFQSKTM